MVVTHYGVAGVVLYNAVLVCFHDGLLLGMLDNSMGLSIDVHFLLMQNALHQQNLPIIIQQFLRHGQRASVDD